LRTACCCGGGTALQLCCCSGVAAAPDEDLSGSRRCAKLPRAKLAAVVKWRASGRENKRQAHQVPRLMHERAAAGATTAAQRAPGAVRARRARKLRVGSHKAQKWVHRFRMRSASRRARGSAAREQAPARRCAPRGAPCAAPASSPRTQRRAAQRLRGRLVPLPLPRGRGLAGRCAPLPRAHLELEARTQRQSRPGGRREARKRRRPAAGPTPRGPHPLVHTTKVAPRAPV